MQTVAKFSLRNLWTKIKQIAKEKFPVEFAIVSTIIEWVAPNHSTPQTQTDTIELVSNSPGMWEFQAKGLDIQEYAAPSDEDLTDDEILKRYRILMKNLTPDQREELRQQVFKETGVDLAQLDDETKPATEKQWFENPLVWLIGGFMLYKIAKRSQ